MPVLPRFAIDHHPAAKLERAERAQQLHPVDVTVADGDFHRPRHIDAAGVFRIDLNDSILERRQVFHRFEAVR